MAEDERIPLFRISAGTLPELLAIGIEPTTCMFALLLRSSLFSISMTMVVHQLPR
jgi:hypothetical protein